MPYLFDMFNLHGYYGSAAWGVNKFFNPLVDAFNERPHFPKLLVLIYDKDILLNLRNSKIHTGIILGGVIHYLIQQIDVMISRKQSQLMEKKPGAVTTAHPKIVWIRMLKRPEITTNGSIIKSIVPNRGKFNSILEECIAEDGGDTHHIMSIEVDKSEFDGWGNLTNTGESQFWMEVDKGLQRFDKGDITLKARNFNLSSGKKPKKAKTANDFVAKSPTNASFSRE